MIELPRVATNHTSSKAYGINDRGDVVGRSGASQFSATVWLDGEAYDLNELIASDDPLKQYITLWRRAKSTIAARSSHRGLTLDVLALIAVTC